VKHCVQVQNGQPIFAERTHIQQFFVAGAQHEVHQFLVFKKTVTGKISCVELWQLRKEKVRRTKTFSSESDESTIFSTSAGSNDEPKSLNISFTSKRLIVPSPSRSKWKIIVRQNSLSISAARERGKMLGHSLFFTPKKKKKKPSFLSWFSALQWCQWKLERCCSRIQALEEIYSQDLQLHPKWHSFPWRGTEGLPWEALLQPAHHTNSNHF
jgi:hypothetical protein